MSNWQPYPTDTVHGHTISGNVLQWPQFHSPQLNNRRDLLVYLPPSYTHGDKRYSVLYMHDGQNLFDAATAFGRQEWRVDETLQDLSNQGIEAIVVGLPNSGEQRIREYNPFAHRNQGRGEDYIRFILDSVKPTIDRDFRTQTDASHTGIMGSSMGGLISLYAFFRHSDVFGLAGVMSPALWYGAAAIYDVVRGFPLNSGRIYLDNGTKESSARPMYQLLRERGYKPNKTVKYVAERGAQHNEAAWARRLPDALRFLLQKL